MRRVYSAISLATLLLVAVAGQASLSAQESTTRGFTIGLHTSGQSLAFESEDANSAAGGGLFIGYGINRKVTLFAQADGGQFDEQSSGIVNGEWTMAHFDLGFRYHFANSLRRWIPYLQASIGGRAISVANPVLGTTQYTQFSMTGSILSIGGGVDYYVTETVALDLQLLFSGGEFRTWTIDNISVGGIQRPASSGRVNFGVNWWP